MSLVGTKCECRRVPGHDCFRMYCGRPWYVETAAATGLPIRDVSFRGEFRRLTGPAAEFCGFWVSPPSAIVYAIPEFIYGMSGNKDRNENDVEVLLQRRAQSDQGRALSRGIRASVPSGPGRHPQGRSAQARVSRDQSECESARHR